VYVQSLYTLSSFLKIGYILKWQATRVAYSYKANLRRSIMAAVYNSCNNNEQDGEVWVL